MNSDGQIVQARANQSYLGALEDLDGLIAKRGAKKESSPGVLATAGAVAADVYTGATEIPRALVTGVGKAADEMLDNAWQLATWDSEANVPLEDLLPDDPESVTGGFIQGAVQFVAGMVPVAKGLKAAGVASKGVRYGLAGIAAEPLAMDEHEDRLSNLIQSVPALQNPVTDYLEAEDDDPVIEGKIKQALEGAGIDMIAGGVLAGIKTLRGAKKLEEAKFADKGADDALKASDAPAPSKEVEAAPNPAMEAVKEPAPFKPLEQAELAPKNMQQPATLEPEAAAAKAEADVRAQTDVPAPTLRDLKIVGDARRPVFRVDGGVRQQAAGTLAKLESQPEADRLKSIGEQLKALRSQRPADRPKGLAEYLRTLGPILDEGGELRQADLARYGLMRGKPGAQAVNLDDATLRAWEAGYFPEFQDRPSIQDMLEALQDEARFGPRVSTADEQAAQAFEDIDNFGQMLDELGLDAQVATADDVARALDDAAKPAIRSEPAGDGMLRQADEAEADGLLDDARPIDADDIARQIDDDPFSGEMRFEVAPGKVGNINLANLGTGDDVRALIRALGEAVPIKSTTRQSTDEARALADKLLVDPEKMVARFKGMAADGRAFTRSEILATRQLMTNNGERILSMAQKIVSEGANDAERFAFKRQIAFQNAIMRVVSDQAREAGRALQAFATITRGNAACL